VAPDQGVTPEPVLPWAALLWIVPAETRLGVREVAEALGRPRSFVYRHTGPKAPGARIPHRRLDGELVFLAGEIRRWIEDHEVVVVPGRVRPLVVSSQQRQGAA
jgi:predicted DNA-binding transcriptional regulator AlpA